MDLGRALLLAALLALAGCDDGGGDGDGDVDGDVDADGEGDADFESADGDSDSTPDIPFAVTGVEPRHGIFTGGTEVLIRGRGFEPGAQVSFGDRVGGWNEVPAEETLVVDENRIGLLTPPGEPGSWADVRVLQGDDQALLSWGCPDCEGYYYDPCELSPRTGSVVGGTYVVLSCLGTEFLSGSVVTFDGALATDVEVVSESEIHLRTPPGLMGPADVVVDHEALEDDELVLEAAYDYYQNTDPGSGGLGGDPIEGNVEVSVFDGGSGGPLSEAFVMLGIDGATRYQGWTDETGSIVFSGPDLSGRQLIITVSHAPVPTPYEFACDPEDDPDGDGCCQDEGPPTVYETASFTEFDASFVSVLLQPFPPMIMAMPCDSLEPPPPTYVEGELLFEDLGEFGPYNWEIVPETLSEDEARVAFVYATAPDIFQDLYNDPDRDELYETGTIDGGRCPVVTCAVDADCRPFRNAVTCEGRDCSYLNAVCNRVRAECFAPRPCESSDDCPFTGSVCDRTAGRCIIPEACSSDDDCARFDNRQTESSCDTERGWCVIREWGERISSVACVGDGDCLEVDDEASCDVERGFCVYEALSAPRSVAQIGDSIRRGHVVLEDGAEEITAEGSSWNDGGVVGENGFTYCLRSRTGAVAIYALAGLINRRTSVFTPWAFGVHRGVLVPRGGGACEVDEDCPVTASTRASCDSGRCVFTVTNVDIPVVTELSETVFLSLDGAPTPVGWDTGPNRFFTELYVDLGVEGVIWRPDRISTRDLPLETHQYASWMPREGALSDATLTVVANAFSYDDVNLDGVEDLVYPLAIRYQRGIVDWSSEIVIGDWIGPAHPDDPDYSGTVTDNRISWDLGPGDYDFTDLRMSGGGLWEVILPSEQSDVVLPPLPEELLGPDGEVQLDVWQHRVQPGFDFDLWSYRDLGRDNQSGFAGNAWFIYFE